MEQLSIGGNEELLLMLFIGKIKIRRKNKNGMIN